MMVGKFAKGNSGSGTTALYVQVFVLFFAAWVVMKLGSSFEFQSAEDLQKIDDMDDSEGKIECSRRKSEEKEDDREVEKIPLKAI